MLIETLERRTLLSATLSNIATFNGANGFSPSAVVEDANRNIFGVTQFVQAGQNEQSGEVFEVAAGTNTIKVLSQFNTAGGIISPTSLIIDSSGNLFGTANGGPSNGGAFVFEVAAGSSTVTNLAAFPTASSSIGSQGNLKAVDSAGNLFGVDDLGNVFEVIKNSGVISTVANSGQTISAAVDLALGPDGNLYSFTGTSINKISPTTAQVTPLGTVGSSLGSEPMGITLDSAGDVWGFNQLGSTGPNIGGGTVWELPAGQSTVLLVDNFTAASGYNPVSRPVFGTDGNLYGITENGGANGDGSLFDVPTGSSITTPGTVTDVVDFNSAEQAPDAGCGIVANSSGVASGIISGQQDIPFFGALFGSVSASASTNALHPDFNGGFGSLLDVDFGPIHTKDDEEFLKQRLAHDKDVIDRLIKAVKSGQPTPPDLLNQHLLAALDLTLMPQKLTAAQLAPINKAIAAQQKNLTAVGVLLNKDTSLTSQYNRETKTIASLEAQLAKAKSKTAIQKKLNAAEALQAKLLNQGNTALSTAATDLNTFDTQISTIVSQYNALLG